MTPDSTIPRTSSSNTQMQPFSSLHSLQLSLPLPLPPPAARKCRICFRAAHSNNYGVLTCDACKMFFKRVSKKRLLYFCERDRSCFENFQEGLPFPNCKRCRFEQCRAVGMVYERRRSLEVKNDDGVMSILTDLLEADRRRTERVASFVTFQDSTLREIVENRELRRYLIRRYQPMHMHEWSFMFYYTTVEFLMELGVMSKLATEDQLLLLYTFAGQASLFEGAMRTFREKGDRLITFDGEDVFPDFVKCVFKFNERRDHLLNRIRSLLISRLIELKVTNEEFVLITVVLFCNPGVPGLSENAKMIVGSHQTTLCNVLLKHCQQAYQTHGPSRFTDLLSLCHVIRRNFEDVQHFMIIFKMKFPAIENKKLVDDLTSIS